MKKQNKIDKYLLLSKRKLWILAVSGFLAILLHNIIYALFEFEEAIFLIYAAIIVPSYFLMSFLYTLIQKIKNKSIFNSNFIIRSIIAIIIGEIISGILVQTSIINISLFYVLAIVFSFIAYYLIKQIKFK